MEKQKSLAGATNNPKRSNSIKWVGRPVTSFQKVMEKE